MSITCGHFNFVVRDSWILCQECGHGISVNSRKGQRLLEKKKGKPLLDEQQQATYNALVESYQELVSRAGTTNPEVLAALANGKEQSK